MEQQPQQEVPAQKSCYFNFKWPKTNLTFSYEGEHRYYGNAWQAAKNWSDLNAGITIKPAPEGEEGDIVFKDVYDRSQTWYGKTETDGYDMDDPRNSRTTQNDPHILDQVTIEMNQYTIENFDMNNHDPKKFAGRTNDDFKLSDSGRTYVATHELGHALGLAHPENCQLKMESIVNTGNLGELPNEKPFNTPQEYDRIALRGLYGIHGVDNVLGNYA